MEWQYGVTSWSGREWGGNTWSDRVPIPFESDLCTLYCSSVGMEVPPGVRVCVPD